MRKRSFRIMLAGAVLATLVGPMTAVAQAGPDGCKLAEKLGVVWVRECGS